LYLSADPDAEVLHGGGLALEDLVAGDDLTVGLLHLLQQRHEVPAEAELWESEGELKAMGFRVYFFSRHFQLKKSVVVGCDPTLLDSPRATLENGRGFSRMKGCTPVSIYWVAGME